MKFRSIPCDEAWSPSPPWYQEPIPSTYDDALAQGEWAAEQERRRLGKGTKPIDNVSELIVSQGIWESAIELPDKVRCLVLNNSEIGIGAIINLRHWETQIRFSYALAYAHVILDQDSTVVVSSGFRQPQSNLLARANAFSSAFLMPRMAVIDSLSPGSQNIKFKDINKIAEEFHVSERAAEQRLNNLRVLSKPENLKLFKQNDLRNPCANAIGVANSKHEFRHPNLQGSDVIKKIAALAMEAYRQEEISRGRILELSGLLELDGDGLLRWADSLRDNN